MTATVGGRRRHGIAIKYLAILAVALFVSAGIAAIYTFSVPPPGTKTTS